MTIAANDMHNADYSATYCPEDNKIRLYCGRVERSTYDFLRANKFLATPKQSCDFVATWSTAAEDIALAMIAEDDDIGDEDYSPEERAADRAERFSDYRDKRRSEAGDHADRYDARGQAGFQSAARAARYDRQTSRTRNRALCQWSKAEYWQTRTAGVISNALHKSSPSVRRGRILTIESEQRKHAADMESVRKHFAGWQAVAAAEGADVLIVGDESGYGYDAEQATPAGKLAYAIANSGQYHWRTTHPDHQTGDESDGSCSPYDLLRKNGVRKSGNLRDGNIEYYRQLTPGEVAALYIGTRTEAISPTGRLQRWADHYDNRLAYERQMLAAEGGSVADVEIVPGGWFGKYQVVKVHKSPATKRPVSVSVYNSEGKLARINIQRLGEDSYRAPSEIDLAEFKADELARKKAAKATKPKAPSLINPTEADAKRLQAILNAKRGKGFTADDAAEITLTTQATYSANSKGSYSRCKTVEITERLEKYNPGYYGGENQHGQTVVFKVRMFGYSVVVLTDKPQKPLPFEQCAEIEAGKPSFMEMVGKLQEFTEAKAQYKEDLTPEAAQIFSDLRYHGLGYSSSQCQWGLSETGRKWHAVVRMLSGQMLAGHAYGLLDKDGKPTAGALEMAQQIEPGLISFDESGKLYDGKVCAAAQLA